MPHGIYLVKMVFDKSKNHLNLVKMINQKCQPRHNRKSTQPNHNGQVQNDLLKMTKSFFSPVQNGFFLTKIYSKKT
jgi:hypothetical protein